MTLGILAIGGYLPKTRLQRTDIAKANAWFNPAPVSYTHLTLPTPPYG